MDVELYALIRSYEYFLDDFFRAFAQASDKNAETEEADSTAYYGAYKIEPPTFAEWLIWQEQKHAGAPADRS